MKKLKTSLFARSAQLLGVAGQIASHELTQKIKSRLVEKFEDNAPELIKTRIAQAKILTQNLSQLKGAAMKAGQLLSIDSSDLIPPEATEILSQLQHLSEPVDFEELRDVLEHELHADNLSQLQVDSQPFSSASIGQVHKAHWGDRLLALKIQYPGVSDTIDSDLALLKKIVGAFLTLSQRRMDLDDLFRELGVLLHQETDYLREREFLLDYKKHIAAENLENTYIVPEVYPQFSGRRVLAMSFEEGLTVNQWLATQPTMEKKQRVAQQILDLYCLEFFQWGLVQTDPNYGNFLIREPDQLVLLDFGATMKFEREFVERYKEVLRTFIGASDQEIIDTSIEFQLLDPRENDEAKKYYVEFMRLTVEPFLPEKQPFLFSDETYTQRSIESGRKFSRSLKYSPPPRHIIFLHRKLGGIFNLLRRMQVQLNLTPYWDKMVNS